MKKNLSLLMGRYRQLLLIALIPFFAGAQAGGLVLKHSYTFDTDASDQVGTVHGTLKGNAVVANGALVTSQNGDYVSFNGADFNFNAYTAITMEHFVVAGNGTNPGWTGLSYFGNNDGAKTFFTGIARGDNKSISFFDYKAEIKSTTEHDDGKYHHVVSVLTPQYLKFYIDGVLIGQANWSGSIDIGTTHAYLGKLGWAADPTWNGKMLEYNIYEGEMDAQTVAQRAVLFDRDADGALNDADNCPDTYNPGQNDLDKDGVGDVCDHIATLSGLTVDNGTLRPAFSPTTFNYVVYAPMGVGQVNFAATAADQAFAVSGATPVDISSGSGVGTITVAMDGYDSGVYTVTVYGLKLEHAYPFDTDASDKVGTVHGTLQGGAKVVNGALVTSKNGDYVSFNGADFNFGSYESITMEHFVVAGNGDNPGWTGLSYFGDNAGAKALFTGIARGDNKSICFYNSKAEVKATREHDDGRYHHIVSVLTREYLALYIDGVLVGRANWSGTIDIGTTYAYLAKLGWAADPTWIGKILEFNIYRGVMDDATIAQRRLLFDKDGDGIATTDDDTEEQWNANWIWENADGPKDTWMCFRKTFDLATVPQKALARIAAESKYWLWVNGKMVVFEGMLKRDLMTKAYYDEVDLSPYLVEGTNTISAQVWYWGREGFAHHDTGKGGFLFDADWNGTQVVSNATWKVKAHPGYEHSITGGQPNFRLSEWNVRFNAANDNINGWQQPGYDDSAWAPAANKGVPPSLPWNSLMKRPFPQWKDSGLQEYTNAGALPAIGNGGVVEGILPYDARVSAYLKVKATAGQLINIQTDQYDGWYAFGDGPAVRAEYITTGGEQEFETLLWMSGNTVRYTIPAGVEIVSLKYRELGYPAEFTGDFSCSDPFYSKLWGMARRTLYINMYDNFMDCPDRERALWWGDVVNQSGEVFYTLDTTAHALIRKSIHTLTDWQRDDNTLYSPTSTLWSAELPQQMLASIGWYGFYNYFMNTNDSATIRQAYPAVRKYLSIWSMGANGLVVHRKGAWDWGDWGTNIDIDVLDNAWYYLALKAAIPMAAMSGQAQDTTAYRTRMTSIEANFAKVFWKESGQQFRSSALTIPDDRANAMAVLAGLAKTEHHAGVRSVLTSREFASPYMEKYVLEALCKIGSDSLALVRMKKRYAEMVNSQYSTLWEVWSGLKDGTINHGWNAPNTVLSQNIAGLSPVQPGWAVYEVMPRMGGLAEVSQTVPTVKGNITVKHLLSASHFKMNLESPQGTKALVGIPVKGGVQSISVNGTVVWGNGAAGSVAGVTGAGQNASYILFSVDAGVWEFDAEYSASTGVGSTELDRKGGDFVEFTNTAASVDAFSPVGADFELTVYDLTGRQVIDTVKSKEHRVSISLKSLTEGIFIMQANSEQASVTRRLLVAR